MTMIMMTQSSDMSRINALSTHSLTQPEISNHHENTPALYQSHANSCIIISQTNTRDKSTSNYDVNPVTGNKQEI